MFQPWIRKVFWFFRLGNFAAIFHLDTNADLVYCLQEETDRCATRRMRMPRNGFMVFCRGRG
jgi:hypothetical protein